MTALGLTVFSLIYEGALRKFSLSSLLGAILLVIIIATDLLYKAAPTAVYFLLFPLLSVLVGGLLVFRKKTEESWSPLLLIFLLPAIIMLSPLVYFTFVAFGLSDQVSAVLIFLGLLAGLLLPLFAGAFSTRRWLVPIIAAAITLVSLIGAHIKSGYTDQHPLQTNLRYVVDADKEKAWWMSDFEAIDHWEKPFFAKMNGSEAPEGFHPALINKAPFTNIPAPILTLQKDSLDNGHRKVWLHCQAREGAITARMTFSKSSPITRIVVDGKEGSPEGSRTWEGLSFYYRGLPKEGFDFMVELPSGSPLDCNLVDRSIGLPEVRGFNTAYPADVIPGPDYNSNTIQVTKHYRF
jgi:hypothetical protein